MKKITISGVIGWDVEADDVRQALAEANGGDVELLISSPGGLVSACLEMFNLIRNYPGHTTARLTGFAMSAASYIPLAADKVIAEDNAVYMIHNVHGGVWGDHNYILKYGKDTAALSMMMAGAYVRFTGKGLAEITSMMDEETYFYGEAIVDAGFAHELVEFDMDDEEDRSNMHEDQLMASARNAYNVASARLSSDTKAVADDLAMAVALAGPEIKKVEEMNHRAKSPATTTKEHRMDLEMLKKKHPDLVAAVTDEAIAEMTEKTKADITAAMEEGRAEGRTEGAEQERKRIDEVQAQLIVGHEKVINSMAFDGKSTGGDAAKAMVAAENELRGKARDKTESEANDAVDSAEQQDGNKNKMSRKAFDSLTSSAQAKFIADGGSLVD